MIVLDLYTTETVLSVSSRTEVTSNSVNSFEVSTNFDDFWNGYSKILVFYTNNSKIYEVYLLESNTCKIPNELLVKDGKLFIGARGIKADGSVLSSTITSFNVKVGTPKDGNAEITLTPDMTEQLQMADRRLFDKITNVEQSLTTPFNFKGSCLSTELATKTAGMNDTWYCTDLKYRMTFNGAGWKQSSFSESDYTDALGKIASPKETATDDTKIAYEIGDDEIEIPTMEDFNALKETVENLKLQVVQVTLEVKK